jgi:hypothetical protein
MKTIQMEVESQEKYGNGNRDGGWKVIYMRLLHYVINFIDHLYRVIITISNFDNLSAYMGIRIVCKKIDSY